MTMTLLLALSAMAKPPDPPQIDEIAQNKGLEAAWQALQQMPTTYPKAKHLEAARAQCGLDRVQMPVQLKMGAELTLEPAGPLEQCALQGEHLSCLLRLATKTKVAAQDYQVSCRTSFGATLPLQSSGLDVSDNAMVLRVDQVERCWEIDALGIRVQPISHDDLQGIGKGTVLIPPELVALSWQEAEAVIMDHMSQFKYCYQRYEDGPTGVGKLKVRYHIAEDGTVDKASIEEPTFNDDRVTGCIISRFERMRFPPPMEGWTGGTFPFTFQR